MADLLRRDQPLPDDRVRLGDYLAAWLANREDIRPSTRATWKRAIDNLIVGLGRIRVVSLRPSTVDAALADMPKGIAPNARSVLTAALKDAQRDGIVDRNAGSLAKPLHTRRGTPRVPSSAEVQQLVTIAKTHRLGALYVVALSTGLRLSELSGLRWPDIDGDRITVHRGLVYVNSRPSYQDPKTPSAKRTVLLTPAAQEALERHKAQQRLERVGNRKWQPNELVFTNRDGEPLHPNTVRWTLDALCKLAGIERFPMHSTRRYYATIVTSSADLKTAAVSLGHRAQTMTDVYARGTDEQRERARDIMTEAMG